MSEQREQWRTGWQTGADAGGQVGRPVVALMSDVRDLNGHLSPRSRDLTPRFMSSQLDTPLRHQMKLVGGNRQKQRRISK